jgi:hypothetical protein
LRDASILNPIMGRRQGEWMRRRLESNQTQHGINFINTFLFRISNLLISIATLWSK